LPYIFSVCIWSGVGVSFYFGVGSPNPIAVKHFYDNFKDSIGKVGLTQM